MAVGLALIVLVVGALKAAWTLRLGHQPDSGTVFAFLLVAMVIERQEKRADSRWHGAFVAMRWSCFLIAVALMLVRLQR